MVGNRKLKFMLYSTSFFMLKPSLTSEIVTIPVSKDINFPKMSKIEANFREFGQPSKIESNLHPTL